MNTREAVETVLGVKGEDEELLRLSQGEMEELQNNIVLLKSLADFKIMSDDAKSVISDVKLLTGHVQFLARLWGWIETTLDTKEVEIASGVAKLICCYASVGIVRIVQLGLLATLYRAMGSDDLYASTLLLLDRHKEIANTNFLKIGNVPSESNNMVFGQIFAGLSRKEQGILFVYRDYIGIERFQGRLVHIFNVYYQEWMICGSLRCDNDFLEVSTKHRRDNSLPPDSLFLVFGKDAGMLIFSCMAGGFLFASRFSAVYDKSRRRVFARSPGNDLEQERFKQTKTTDFFFHGKNTRTNSLLLKVKL